MAVFIAGQKSRGLLRSQARMTQVCKRSQEVQLQDGLSFLIPSHHVAAQKRFPSLCVIRGQKPQSVSAAGLAHRQIHWADTNLYYIPAKLISDRQER